MTKIVICGANGKMGQTIYRCIKERKDCKVIGGIDINTHQYADFPIYSSVNELPEKPDAIIDYSHPSCLTPLLEYCMTTGTRINLLVQLAKKATAILGDQFDIEIIEKHHNQKIDAPSGTALMIANAINETRNDDMKYTYDRHSQRKKREPNEIGIHAVRGGTIVGVHEVLFAGNDETITISHSAASKTVFAEGSINAAIFVKSQKPGLYDMGSIVG